MHVNHTLLIAQTLSHDCRLSARLSEERPSASCQRSTCSATAPPLSWRHRRSLVSVTSTQTWKNGTKPISTRRASRRSSSLALNAQKVSDRSTTSTFSATFSNGAASLNDPVPQKYIQLEQLGAPLNTTQAPTSIDGVLPVPVFMYHSESDGTVAYAPVPAYVDSQCARGAALTFANTTGTAHSATYVAFEGDVYAFLQQAFDGTVQSTGCTRRQQGVENAVGSAGYIQNIGLAAWTLLASAGATSRRRSYGW
jgi:hypothetical protein